MFFVAAFYLLVYIHLKMSASKIISVNGKSYKWPSKPAIIICLDGSEPGPKGYIDTAIRMGLMPFMKSMISKSTYEVGKCAMPSFTNEQYVNCYRNYTRYTRNLREISFLIQRKERKL